MEVIAIDMPAPPPKTDMTVAKKTKRMSCCQALKKSCVEFCATSSIHGFQYFGHSRNWKEKCFWMLVFVVSLYFCGSMIYKAYVKWHETPVIVTISEKSTPIWSIPFPAVTICPETKRAINETGKWQEKKEHFLKIITDLPCPFQSSPIRNSCWAFKPTLKGESSFPKTSPPPIWKTYSPSSSCAMSKPIPASQVPLRLLKLISLAS